MAIRFISVEQVAGRLPLFKVKDEVPIVMLCWHFVRLGFPICQAAHDTSTIYTWTYPYSHACNVMILCTASEGVHGILLTKLYSCRYRTAASFLSRSWPKVSQIIPVMVAPRIEIVISVNIISYPQKLAAKSCIQEEQCKLDDTRTVLA